MMNESIGMDMETIKNLKPATSNISTSLHEPVKLRLPANVSDAIDKSSAATPISIPDLFERTVHKYADHPALVYENADDKQWTTINYREYKANVLHVAKAFMKLGLEPRMSVGVLAFNCPQWFYTEFGAIFAGGIVAGIYTTNSPEAVYHVLSTSDAHICIVDDTRQMEKVRFIKERLPKLKAIIQLHGPFEPYVGVEEGLYKWSDIEQMDTSDLDGELEKRLRDVAVNECAMLIYTSGTVGMPKAVMLSHDNITWNTTTTAGQLDRISSDKEVIVSYLPLNHIAAQIMDVFLPLLIGASVHFANRNALKGTLVQTLTKARPTLFLAVPRVYEKMEEQILTAFRNKTSHLGNFIIGTARNTVKAHHFGVMKGKSTSCITYWLAQKFVRRVHANLGLDKCNTFLVGGAPIKTDTKEFFLSLDMKILEVYGLSETTGAVTLVRENDMTSFESCGKVLPGLDLKIEQANERGHGEVCMRGRNIFMGYLGSVEQTESCLGEDGWFHSGDIGFTDENGNLTITGRLKELIITAGGENVPPVYVEDMIKRELPALSNVFLVGDKRKFLSVLVSIKTNVDPTSAEPLDDLHPDAIDWIKSLGLEYSTLSEIFHAGPCPKVRQSIQEAIDRANSKALSTAQKVQKFDLLPSDFSIPTGELGPTLKIKRNFVVEKYRDLIDDLYDGEGV